MTTLTLTFSVSLAPLPAWVHRGAAWLAKGRAALLARASVAQTRAVLRRLDDETLADIGLPRLDQFGRPAAGRSVARY